MNRRALSLTLVTALSSGAPFGCRSGEHVGTVAGPPLTIAPADAAIAQPAAGGAQDDAAIAPSALDAKDASEPEPASPIEARFVELDAKGREAITLRPCEQVFVAIARGKGKAAGESLGVGDVLVARGGALDVNGPALALVASMRPSACEPSAPSPITRKVARASAAPDLVFAGGKMHAHLDVESAVSPLVYFGRLAGTAPVAEHVHETSWEVLCAVDAAGTFTLAGKEQRLGPKQIVMVPPATKHSWKPDDGAPLFAFQMYTPPGPEQRFKKLAADAADAGKTPPR